MLAIRSSDLAGGDQADGLRERIENGGSCGRSWTFCRLAWPNPLFVFQRISTE